MFKNYFKIALRGLWKQKTFSFLNIAGLAIGIASAALIFLWVEDEMTYDHQHANRNQLYQVMANQSYDGKMYTFSETPGPLAQAMIKEIPGIKNACRMNWGNRTLVNLGDKSIYEQGYYTDPSFFKLFSFPFIKGNPDNIFPQLHSIVISENMAKKFFGDQDALGKLLKFDHQQEYLVTGVFRDIPSNSSFRFDWLAPLEIFMQKKSMAK